MLTIGSVYKIQGQNTAITNTMKYLIYGVKNAITMIVNRKECRNKYWPKLLDTEKTLLTEILVGKRTETYVIK